MMLSNPADEEVAALLTSTRTIAVVGASPNPARPSNEVMAFLISKRFEVYPINPGVAGKTIHGREVCGSLADVPVPVDMVDCFRRSELIEPIADEAIKIGAKSLWMQLEVVNEPAAEKARQQGLVVVMNRCPVIEWRRLGLA